MASPQEVLTASGRDSLTDQEVQQFHQQGYLILRGLGDEDLRRRMLHVTLEGLHRSIEPLEFEADVHYPGAPESRSVAGGQTVRRLKQAFSRDIVFLEWIQSPAILNRLKQLLGPQVLCPLAHHNCIMTKEPRFSSDTGWHQDIRYWSFEQPELISVWLALGKENLHNGCLQVIPGSHRVQYDRDCFDDAKFFRADLDKNAPVLAQRRAVELEPGDVLFFHCKTLHAATRNYSEDTKYSVVFTFRSSDNPPVPGSRSSASAELLLH
ncbi:MAG: phytanoyl-CoA dioxygenase family protein [Planctomycetaceae bacterium]|nr:phytanoyl-CoA dioxygenase family protein [Planctomycetaceae bacterium]